MNLKTLNENAKLLEADQKGLNLDAALSSPFFRDTFVFKESQRMLIMGSVLLQEPYYDKVKAFDLATSVKIFGATAHDISQLFSAENLNLSDLPTSVQDYYAQKALSGSLTIPDLEAMTNETLQYVVATSTDPLEVETAVAALKVVEVDMFANMSLVA